MGNKLFRQQAMDTFESPDKINDYIKVTGPGFIIWLTGILICVVSVCIWAFNTNINDFVNINGLAFPHGKIMHISAPIQGRVSQVYIQKGDIVKKGDILFRYRTEDGVHELRSNAQGVVLSHLVPQENFSAMEPCVYLLPENQINQLKEIVAFVTYADLRKLKVGMEVQATPTDLKREEVGYMYGHITSINELPTSSKEAERIFVLKEFTDAVFPNEASFMVKIRLEDNPYNKDEIRWSHQGRENINIKIGTFCNLQIVTRNRSIFDLVFNKGAI